MRGMMMAVFLMCAACVEKYGPCVLPDCPAGETASEVACGTDEPDCHGVQGGPCACSVFCRAADGQ
jgi:hypothetical protein